MRGLLYVICLAVTPTVAHARPPAALWVRPNLTAAELEADGEICLKEAKAAERAGPRATNPSGSAAGALAAGMAKGLSDMDRFMAAHEACGARLGYTEHPLTGDDRERYRTLKKPEDRMRFHLEFSAKATAPAPIH